MNQVNQIAAITLLLAGLAACSSTPPYRPANFSDFFQGTWTMTERRCDRDGDCDKDGTGRVMVVQGNKLAMLKDASAATPDSVLIFKMAGRDRLRLTNVESGRTFLGSIVFRTEDELLIESRRIPASFEMWERQKNSE